jgi:hypothetical protein
VTFPLMPLGKLNRANNLVLSDYVFLVIERRAQRAKEMENCNY